MQFALLIFEPPQAFAARNADESDPYLGAWRAYHNAIVEAGIFVGGQPLQPPETGTTVRLKDGKRRVQDGPFADTKLSLIHISRHSPAFSGERVTGVGQCLLLHQELLPRSLPLLLRHDRRCVGEMLFSLFLVFAGCHRISPLWSETDRNDLL